MLRNVDAGRRSTAPSLYQYRDGIDAEGHVLGLVSPLGARAVTARIHGACRQGVPADPADRGGGAAAFATVADMVRWRAIRHSAGCGGRAYFAAERRSASTGCAAGVR